MRLLKTLFVLCCLLLAVGSASARNLAPNDEERRQAENVARMRSDSPIDRLVQVLAALDLSDPALFTLAGLEPILVDQVIDPGTHRFLEYMRSMPATELSDLRAGQTVVRTKASWSKRETERLIDMASEFGLKKPTKLASIRIGVVPGLKVTAELVGKKGNYRTEFAFSTTPERENSARERLTRHFGARPAEIASGPGSKLPLEDSSFERKESLGSLWILETLVEKGSPLPMAEVALDRDVVLDGRASLRFHSDAGSRSWLGVSQAVTVSPGMPLLVKGHFKARNVRAERDQERIFRARLVFTDASGNMLDLPVSQDFAMSDTDWREFQLKGVVPSGAGYVRVEMACTMSGTAWFDAFTMTIGF